MTNILRALQRAAQDQLSPRMIGLAFWPMGFALLACLAIALGFGASWREGIEILLADTPVQDWLASVGAAWLMSYLAVIVLLLFGLPALYLVALLVSAVVLMPRIVRFVADRHYPGLERRHGGTFIGGLWNVLVAVVLYLLAWGLAWPVSLAFSVWIFAPFAFLISLVLNAWLSRRLFLYDALAEHADPGELDAARKNPGWSSLLLGGLLGLLYLVPLLNLLAPIYMGLAFAHFELDALSARRAGRPNQA